MSASGRQARISYRVTFDDTDSSGRLYWGSMFRIFSEAEVELWRGLDALEMYRNLPRAHAEADYLDPMQFDDLLEVEATLEHVGNSSVRVAFRIERLGKEIGRGHVVAVHVDPAGVPVSVSAYLGPGAG